MDCVFLLKLYGNYYFAYIWLHFWIAALQIPCHTPKKSQKKFQNRTPGRAVWLAGYPRHP